MVQKIEKVMYTTRVVATGGRSGTAQSDDGHLLLELTRPGARSGTNPEQLLAAGWGACFASTLVVVAKQAGQTAEGVRVAVTVRLGTAGDGSYTLAAQIRAAVPALDAGVLEALMEQAHGRCPYSRALRDSIEVDLGLLDEGETAPTGV